MTKKKPPSAVPARPVVLPRNKEELNAYKKKNSILGYVKLQQGRPPKASRAAILADETGTAAATTTTPVEVNDLLEPKTKKQRTSRGRYVAWTASAENLAVRNEFVMS
jgi:hypothetical protein